MHFLLQNLHVIGKGVQAKNIHTLDAAWIWAPYSLLYTIFCDT